LDADSSTPDDNNNKTQVATEDQLSQGAVDKDTDASNEPRHSM
jgi:hypothetical protein